MEGKLKEEPSSPPSPRRKLKRAESPKSPQPQMKESQATSSPSSKSSSADTAQAALTKVRRLLYTLVQHAEDMGCSTAEKVKPLIMALVAGSVTLEEFQSALHETTGSPLRPFVVPYLQAYLPMLQHDCASQARGRKQGILEYLSCTDSAILERGGSPSFVTEVYGKRKLHDRPYDDEPLSLKRPLLVPVHPMSLPEQLPASDEQWRNIHVRMKNLKTTEMLNCTLSMVEKTKQALTLLQHGPSGRETALEEDRIQQTVRLTEERIHQIRKKAEDAILDIKKKAAQEMEKAAAGLKFSKSRTPFQDYF